MWADTLLSLERGHLIRLALWGGASVVLGTALLTFLVWRRTHAPLLRHFAMQTLAWGAVDLALCAWAQRGLHLRDFAGAQSLVSFLWLNTGLDVGYVMVGATLALTCWKLGPRPGGIGAGTAIIVQGLALLLLDIRLILVIGPIR
ncbi:MAG: hypothetical protein KA154_05200 [Gemmatimonadaceae bacterium]|jgi:hypothetical protein|nr:hypothetical protein [Gemmatimonadaceae bacterium]MCC6430300.1 hypothetical protein [Gemmatimonadaceae bacterium]